MKRLKILKGAIRRRKSKDRKYDDHKKTFNIVLQNIAQKTETEGKPFLLHQ